MSTTSAIIAAGAGARVHKVRSSKTKNERYTKLPTSPSSARKPRVDFVLQIRRSPPSTGLPALTALDTRTHAHIPASQWVYFNFLRALPHRPHLDEISIVRETHVWELSAGTPTPGHPSLLSEPRVHHPPLRLWPHTTSRPSRVSHPPTTLQIYETAQMVRLISSLLYRNGKCCKSSQSQMNTNRYPMYKKYLLLHMNNLLSTRTILYKLFTYVPEE